MDLCLQCGRPIPQQVVLQGESRFCSPQHRFDFRQTQERVHLLQIPEPGDDWDMPPAPVGDAQTLADWIAEPCPILQVMLPPRVPALQPLPRKYEMTEISLGSALPQAVLASSSKLAPVRPRALVGERKAEIAVRPQPQRQDRLSRYAMVFSFLRLAHDVRLRTDVLQAKPAATFKQQPPPLYRKLKGFPVFAVAEGEPAICGYVAQQGSAATLDVAVRQMAAEPMDSSAVQPLIPGVRIAAALQPSHAGVARPPVRVADVDDRAPAAPRHIDVIAAAHVPSTEVRLREPWGLNADFVPSMDSLRTVVSSLRSMKFQLRDRRAEFGLHVPQTLMLPLRPRLMLSETETQLDTAGERDSGVVSISSLRAAMGARR